MSMDDLAQEIADQHLERWRIQNQGYIYGVCPFHDSSSGKMHFYIDRESGKWGCWSCGAHGSDLGYLLKELGVVNGSAQKIVKAAREDAKKWAQATKAKKRIQAKKSFKGTHTLPEDLLGVYDWTPTALLDKFSEDVVDEHQIGYDQVNERITFPIRDIEGRLIGISGRRDNATEWGPKYKVYQGPHINGSGKRVMGELGEWFPEYSSSDIRDHLWRGDKVFQDVYYGKSGSLIIVEGYKAALWLFQMGYENTVALMGSHMSENQERLVRRMGTDTWVFLDANKAGRQGSKDICWRLGNASFPVYEVQYPVGVSDEAQPDDLTEEQIDFALENAVRKVRPMSRRMLKQQTERF